MKNLTILLLLFSINNLFAQFEIRTDGVVFPLIKRANVVLPQEGMVIVEPSGTGIPVVYDGKGWTALQHLLFNEGTDRITYTGTKKFGYGVSIPSDFFHVNAPTGSNTLRFQQNGITKFRIFENGGIVFGSNWDVPLENTLRLNTRKTIINDSLVLQDQSFELTQTGGLKMYNNLGTETIHITADNGGDGRITTNELELTGGSDLSEKFNVVEHEKIAPIPGMLVSLSEIDGSLQISKSKYDKRIVGIISGANGIETGLLMGQEGSIADGEFPVALVGRAYVYVTSENGPIEPGDFLTSSSTPGYAMKVKRFRKAQGAIIGKALTSLDDSSGFVLVLVNLQ